MIIVPKSGIQNSAYRFTLAASHNILKREGESGYENMVDGAKEFARTDCAVGDDSSNPVGCLGK